MKCILWFSLFHILFYSSKAFEIQALLMKPVNVENESLTLIASDSLAKIGSDVESNGTLAASNETDFDYDLNLNDTDVSSMYDYDVTFTYPSKLFVPDVSTSNIGFWSVFDEEEPQTDPSHKKRPPSCILARMEISVEVPDLDWSEVLNSTSNGTLWIPSDAVAVNKTCGKVQQSLILIWNHTAEGHIIDRVNLTLVFNQSISGDSTLNALSEIRLTVFHKQLLNSSDVSDFVIEAARQVHMMEAPKLFAFCCQEKIEVPIDGNITYFGVNDSERTEALTLTVVFNHLCVEVFRESRYYEDLTHLKYDCKFGWPYKFVQEAVLASLILFSLVIVASFVARYKHRKQESEDEDK